MAGDLDKQKVSFECPVCGRKMQATIGEQRRSKSMRCPGGHTFDVDGKALDKGLKTVDRAMDSFKRGLK